MSCAFPSVVFLFFLVLVSLSSHHSLCLFSFFSLSLHSSIPGTGAFLLGMLKPLRMKVISLLSNFSCLAPLASGGHWWMDERCFLFAPSCAFCVAFFMFGSLCESSHFVSLAVSCLDYNRRRLACVYGCDCRKWRCTVPERAQGRP